MSPLSRLHVFGTVEFLFSKHQESDSANAAVKLPSSTVISALDRGQEVARHRPAYVDTVCPLHYFIRINQVKGICHKNLGEQINVLPKFIG